MRELIEYVASLTVRFPHLTDRAHAILDECQKAIDNGSNPAHEVAVCYGSIIDLIN